MARRLTLVLLIAALAGLGLGAVAWWRSHNVGPVQRGARLAAERGCLSCHGPAGRLADPDGTRGIGSVPSFEHDDVTGYAKSEAEIREWILDGKPRRLREAPADEPEPLLAMPAWRGRLSAAEVDPLVAYVKAVSDFDPAPEAVAAGRDAAARLGCFACHGPQGRFDTPNPGSLKGYIPSWSGADFPELAKDEVLQRLGTDKASLERDFEAVKVTYRPGAPAYQEAESRLEKIKQRIRDQVAVHLGRIRNEYDLAVSNSSNLRADIQRAEQQALLAGKVTSKYDVAQTDAATTKATYDVIAKTLSEVSVNSQLVANNITVLDRAIPPIHPVAPNKRLNLVLGLLIGSFLGVATAFFLDYLDNTFHRPEDIERHLQLNTLAIIPRFDREQVGTAVLKEAYQTLRTALIFLSKNRERKVVLLTSTAPQEGKSSTTSQLGRALASAGDRVIRRASRFSRRKPQ